MGRKVLLQKTNSYRVTGGCVNCGSNVCTAVKREEEFQERKREREERERERRCKRREKGRVYECDQTK